MIQRDITHRMTAPACACGAATHLIHSRGRATSDPRLLGHASDQYHVECTACGIATPPQFSVAMAINAWRKGNTIHTTQLPAARIALDLARLAIGATA